jgi:hypothetical protein
MTCPKCGFEQPDGRPDCQACGVIFAKWHGGGAPRQLAAQPPPLPAGGAPDIYEPRPPAPRPSSVRSGALPGVLLLAAAGLAAWWINFPKGRSVSASAYRDPNGRFAISPPPGWLTLSGANFQQVMGELRERFPPAMRNAMAGAGVAVAFFQLGDQDQFAPNLNLIVTPHPGIRSFSEKERQQFADMVKDQFARVIPGYRLEGSRIEKLDGVDAIRISGVAADVLVPGLANARGGLRVEQVMVLGRKEAFILSCSVEAGIAEQAPQCESMFNSFRVLSRPSRFDPAITWGLNGGLIGLALAALKMISGS